MSSTMDGNQTKTVNIFFTTHESNEILNSFTKCVEKNRLTTKTISIVTYQQ